MATEGPLVRDGAQCVASADYSNVAGNLAGPNSSGQYLAVKLSTTPRKVVLAVSGGEPIYGILQNKPAAGQVADVGIMGISKAVAGAVCTAGDFLMTDTSGRLIPATSTNARVAQAIESAAATSIIFTVAIVPGVSARTAT